MKKQDSKPAATDGVPSPLSIIRDLQNGTLLPASISSEVRRGCVEHLVGEGYSVAEVAQVFSVSPRTVHRDIAAIREANALQPDPQLVAVMAGRLWGAADQAVQRLRRIAREKETDAAVRVDAERTAWTVQRELVEILQRLGHLPTATQQIRADLVHHAVQPPTYAEMAIELAQFGQIAAETGGVDDATRQLLTELQDLAARSATAQKIESLQKALPPPAREENGNV